MYAKYYKSKPTICDKQRQMVKIVLDVHALIRGKLEKKVREYIKMQSELGLSPKVASLVREGLALRMEVEQHGNYQNRRRR